MTTDDQPVCRSRRTWRSLWQEYRVYHDRLELSSCVGTMVIPVEEILEVEVRPALVIGDWFRGKGFGYCWALKLDLADLCRHVALHRTSGKMKRLRFSPDDPEAFVAACRSVMAGRSSPLAG